MIICEKCKLMLDDGIIVCPQCGDALRTEPGNDEVTNEGSVMSLLASAGIEKAKGNHNQAISYCTEALKLQPKNPQVYSLLGDVYEAMGKHREAAQWFQLVLEVEPNNLSDKAKLESLQKKIADAEDGVISPVSGTKQGWFDRMMIGRGLNPTAKIITVVSVMLVMFLILTGIAAWMMGRRPQEESTVVDAKDPMTTSSQSTSIPPDAPGPASSASAGDSAARTLPSSDNTANRSAEELQLLKAISDSSILKGRNIRIEDAKVDPRVNLLILTFVESGAISRSSIAADAAAVASAAFTASPSMNWVTVRCYGNVTSEMGVTMPSLLMLADVQKSALASLTPQSTLDQIQQVLVKPWWHDSVK